MDLRAPVGVLFVVIGGLLASYGLLVHERAEAHLGFDVNLVWGAVMMIFGALMWVASRVGARRQRG